MTGSAVSDLAGRVLAGRYLLHSSIGTGASGRVYVADDTRLRRRVAVKVLHAALAEDAAFLRRFRAEAQLAASLHHPHIVTVHDWGEDDVPFMVLELLEGGSLRAMLDEGTRLSVAQAARVGRDVASALDYAHTRGVLHRDIKPANLLFDEHGIVRVADFGLARALAEASWTEPAGAMFGTARYASPEQAKGAQLDGRSDLYSLGLVLVESVTGSVPFNADTTLGLLTARTQTPLTAPEELGSLGPVIDRAGALEPTDRYPDAATMRAAISDAADTLPPPSPLTLAGMTDRADPHPTRAVPPAAPPLFDQDTADIAVEPTILVEPDEKKRSEAGPGQKRRLVPFVVAFVVLVIVALAVAAFARVTGATPIQVGNYVGLAQPVAVALAGQDEFETRIEKRAAPDPVDTVIAQMPEAGDFTSSDAITLIVSTGPAPVAVPEIVNQPWAGDNEKTVAELGLIADVKRAHHDTVPAGAVISLAPAAGELMRPDQKLTVVVSDGHAPVEIPDVTGEGSSYEQAKATLEAEGFKVAEKVEEFDSDIPEGEVIETVPDIGEEAPYGATITVIVSKGPDLVEVPFLNNLSFSDAQDELNAVGLKIERSGGGNGRIRSQSPDPGTMVERGSTVTVAFRCYLDFICF
jgi:eukaryotic-like serine/threonine-protein kinase